MRYCDGYRAGGVPGGMRRGAAWGRTAGGSDGSVAVHPDGPWFCVPKVTALAWLHVIRLASKLSISTKPEVGSPREASPVTHSTDPADASVGPLHGNPSILIRYNLNGRLV